jgi:hypothetical protein
MTKLFKCDRCGKIDEQRLEHYGTITHLDKIMEFCEMCSTDVWNYANNETDKQKTKADPNYQSNHHT